MIKRELNMENSTMGRRAFFASVTAQAAAGTGLVFSAQAASGASASGGDSLNLGLIGAGSQGRRLLETCMKLTGVRVRAVCDIWRSFSLMRASRILKQYNQEHNSYSDYRELLRKEKGLDAVIIATPDFRHAEQTEAALDAGLSVYCESPMSDTVEGARKMVTAASKAKGVLQIGFQRRSNPIYRHCCEKLLGEVGLLGRVTTVNGQWNSGVQISRGWPRRYTLSDDELKQHGYESMREFRNWRWIRGLGGGPLASFGSQQLDVYNWFMGSLPESVTATGGTDYYEEKTHQWPDAVLALLDYKTRKGPVRAFYQVITTNSNLGDYEKFLGEKGAMILSEDPIKAMLYREESVMDWDRWVNLDYLKRPDDKKKKQAGASGAALDVTESQKPLEYLVPVDFNGPLYGPHLENFFAAVRGAAAPACPASDAYKTVCLVAAIIEALKKGERVKVAV